MIYTVYAVVVALYTIMGGFLAAVITDVIQNLHRPFRPGRNDRHYINAGRVMAESAFR